MLKISRLADYATLIMHFLAEYAQDCHSAAKLAKTIPISAPTISKILKLLHEAGLVQSIRGSKGGYQLAFPPENISVFAIISAIEGKMSLTQCGFDTSCQHELQCKLKKHWQMIGKSITDFLESLTLADLMHSQIKFKNTIIHFKNRHLNPSSATRKLVSCH